MFVTSLLRILPQWTLPAMHCTCFHAFVGFSWFRNYPKLHKEGNKNTEAKLDQTRNYVQFLVEKCKYYCRFCFRAQIGSSKKTFFSIYTLYTSIVIWSVDFSMARFVWINTWTWTFKIRKQALPCLSSVTAMKVIKWPCLSTLTSIKHKYLRR